MEEVKLFSAPTTSGKTIRQNLSCLRGETRAKNINHSLLLEKLTCCELMVITEDGAELLSTGFCGHYL